MKEDYTLGKPLKQWNEKAQSLTFIVTEDCNLRCKYCYITHKASNAKMSLEVAKKFIDYVLSGSIKMQEAVILDFIGGEPLIEVDLINEICDYFKLKSYEKNSDWYWNYRINISTNGVNYSDVNVQKFINKNRGKIGIGISIDGTKEKHDSQRVFPDNRGSYEAIEKSIPLWISQFGGNTKATFSSDDLKFLKESIISLWDKGITQVAANVVFEDVWKDGDDILLEKQLTELADYALENHLYDKFYCTFFSNNLGGYYNEDDLRRTWCGAGRMLAVGPNGNIYPCIRYKDYSLNKHSERTFGNVNDGIDMERVRPFMAALIKYQSDGECIDCDVANGCAFCQGFNYDEAETSTNFSRAKYICKMHKARVRANDYYFSKLFNLYGIEKNGRRRDRKQLYFLLSNDYTTFCQYKNTLSSLKQMSKNVILDGLKYAHHNFFEPIFVHSKNKFEYQDSKDYEAYRIRHIVPAKFHKEAFNLKDYILVFEKNDLDLSIESLVECQFNIDSHEIVNLSDYIKILLNKTRKINITITNLDSYFDENDYREQLTRIVDHLVKLNEQKGEDYYKISIFEDIFNEISNRYPEHRNCKAGDRSYAYAPNGKFYVCPAYYSVQPDHDAGNIIDGMKLKNQHLYKADYQPICKKCDAYQCINCVYLNESITKEVNISPSYQCRKSHIEREVAVLYMAKQHKNFNISQVGYIDPMESFMIENHSSKNEYLGIYKY